MFGRDKKKNYTQLKSFQPNSIIFLPNSKTKIKIKPKPKTKSNRSG
jgi:hypothetical protein